MDLRSMLNDGAAASSPSPARGPGGTPSKPKHPPPPPPPPGAHHPSTPVQANPNQPFRDYAQSTRASPGRTISHDYATQDPSAIYPSPTTYGMPSPYGAPRPAPHSQPSMASDPRSPQAAAVQSPYRHTPTGSLATSGGGYPFPPAHATPASPVTRQQYPPSGPYPHRDSYSQPQQQAPMTMTAPSGHPAPPGPPSSYMHPQGVPQTPPIGTPGAGHSYIHQRSQSGHSTPTPTSAHSQTAQYAVPYPQGSPVMQHHPPLPSHESARHSSQPPTPLGPPAPAGQQRPHPGGVAYPHAPQPASPYQQRASSSFTGGFAMPQGQSIQASPPPPTNTVVSRANSSIAGHDASISDTHGRSQSRSDRERSISVSPKTRVPSLPSSAGRPSSSSHQAEFRQNSMLSTGAPEAERDRRAASPLKRKMDDRDLPPEEVEHKEARPPPFQGPNGSHVSAKMSRPTSRASRVSTSPLIQRKKRRPVRHNVPPRYAERFSDQQLHKMNDIIRKVTHHAHVNGANSNVVKVKEEINHHSSPVVPKAVAPPQPPPPPQDPKTAQRAMLGPWEVCIEGTAPFDNLAKQVADFLFMKVVVHPDIGDIKGRGVQFEIEAKLGEVTSKDTNERINLPITSECALFDTGRIGFRSNMTEAQHKSFNTYLNKIVFETDPRSKGRAPGRVQLQYLHRREIDKFYELPSEQQKRLPASVRNMLNRGQSVKVRVTYKKDTGEVLAKIVKTRVGDLHLHFPDSPLDCRLSVNLEMDWDGSVEEIEQLAAMSTRAPQPDRQKDRLSYSHGPYQIDLTQVTHTEPGANNTQRMVRDHELEIELAAGPLLQQGTLAEQGHENAYKDLVEGFLANIRTLARQAARDAVAD